MDTGYKGLNGLDKSQIIQESEDSLIVNNVVDENYNIDTELKLINNLKDRLGQNISVKVNIVDRIPLEMQMVSLKQ